MHSRHLMLLFMAALASLVVGCGGGGDGPAPTPGSPGVGADVLSVGPMLVRPASTAGFKVENIPNEWGACSVVGFYGARINYLASQALLDRVVMVSDRGVGPGQNVWVCNLDGSGLTRITSSTAYEEDPQWSRDGRRIALCRRWPASDKEIVVVNADGSSPAALTSNTTTDRHPTWSPDDGRIAFQADRDGNHEVYIMADDGRSPTNITNHAAGDYTPFWSPDGDDPDILFVTNRAGNDDVYCMNEDGSGPLALSPSVNNDTLPAWGPEAEEIAYVGIMGGSQGILVMNNIGADVHTLVRHPAGPTHPAWSGDGKWVVYEQTTGGHPHIFIKQTYEPYATYQVTSGVDNWHDPHLGSPTMQTDRVLIGPDGSDWGGTDPIWSSAYAGICSYTYVGYYNFVRIGVAAADADTVHITGLDGVARNLAVAVVEANAIANLREDAGRGNPPTVWQFGTPAPGAVILHFHPMTGKVVAALASEDTVLPAGAGGRDLVSYTTRGDTAIARGSFSAVFDAAGNRVAGAASQVAIDPAGPPVVLQ